MSEGRKFRHSDVIVLLSYPLLPIVYFAVAATRSAAPIPSWPAVVMLFAAAGSLVILPAWTIFTILRRAGQRSTAFIAGESVLTALWISAGIYAALLDSLRAFLSMVVAAMAGALVFYCSRGLAGRPNSSTNFATNQANSANPTASN
jgi:hypothetical protein